MSTHAPLPAAFRTLTARFIRWYTTTPMVVAFLAGCVVLVVWDIPAGMAVMTVSWILHSLRPRLLAGHLLRVHFPGRATTVPRAWVLREFGLDVELLGSWLPGKGDLARKTFKRAVRRVILPMVDVAGDGLDPLDIFGPGSAEENDDDGCGYGEIARMIRIHRDIRRQKQGVGKRE